MISRHERVVFVHLAIALLPGVELALGNAEPSDELLLNDLRSSFPLLDVIDDFVARIMENPASV
jgi:hypothetical protein